MRFLLRIIPLFIIIMLGISLLRKFMIPQSPRRQDTAGGAPGASRGAKLFKDPVCGTYVTTDGSPTTSIQGEVYYFCSEDCHAKFIRQAS